MDACCTDKATAVERLRERQTTTLRVVLVANATMFVVELVSGLLAGSVALLADSLDMLGDALVYGFSLYVVARGPIWKAQAAVAKAAVMGLFGAFVFGQLVYELAYPQLPTARTMGAVGALICAVFLRSAFLVAREARSELRLNHAQPPVAADAPQAARR